MQHKLQTNDVSLQIGMKSSCVYSLHNVSLQSSPARSHTHWEMMILHMRLWWNKHWKATRSVVESYGKSGVCVYVPERSYLLYGKLTTFCIHGLNVHEKKQRRPATVSGDLSTTSARLPNHPPLSHMRAARTIHDRANSSAPVSAAPP